MMNFFNPPKGVMAVAIALLIYCSACNQSAEKKNETPEMTGMMTYSTTSGAALNAFDEGMDEFYLGNGQLARKKLDEAIKADPNFVMATIFRGYSSRSAKEFSTYGAKVLELKPLGSEAEQMMADIYQTFLKSDIQRQMEISKKLAAAYPNDPMAQIELVNVYSGMDMNDKARELLIKTVKTNPDNAMINMRLANSFMFLDPKDPAMAQKYAAKAVKVDAAAM